jgi:aminoglycoside phosphotransferase (APT) family kinase protein
VSLRTQEDTARLSEHDRERLAESMVHTLVALHEIDPAEVGLANWGRPEGYLQRQLNRWHRQWEASATTPRDEVAELLRRLSAALPTAPQPGIVHGDFKVDNIMVDRFEPATIVGVLDWEMSTLGDTLTDLGILCSFWDHQGEFHNPITAGATALPGFPTRDEVVARYAALRGIDVADLDWYLVFADFKIAVILEGIHARYLQGHTAGEDFEGVGDMVGPLLGRALQIASASSVPGLRG